MSPARYYQTCLYKLQHSTSQEEFCYCRSSFGHRKVIIIKNSLDWWGEKINFSHDSDWHPRALWWSIPEMPFLKKFWWWPVERHPWKEVRRAALAGRTRPSQCRDNWSLVRDWSWVGLQSWPDQSPWCWPLRFAFLQFFLNGGRGWTLCLYILHY